jgi:hypothetical protein
MHSVIGSQTRRQLVRSASLPTVRNNCSRRTFEQRKTPIAWQANTGDVETSHYRQGKRAYHDVRSVSDNASAIAVPAKLDVAATLKHFNQALPQGEQSLPAFMPIIDTLLLSMTSRGIDKIGRREGAGNLLTALHSLQCAQKVLLCTGFNVAPGMPETDGPVGTAILAYALSRCGKTLVVVVDELNEPLMREALRVLDPTFASKVQIERMPGTHEDRTAQAHQMLQRIGPDVVMHIEVPGRNSKDIYSNMVGVSIDDYNKPHDELMNVANHEGIPTIGVGDGGNESGMGGALNVPTAINGNEMQAVVPAMHQIFAWNSNLGAIAPAELLIAINERASPKNRACTGIQLVEIIGALLKGGAVDGVTRGSKLDEKGVDRKGQPAYTAVDGHPSSRHVADLEALHSIVDLMHTLNRIRSGVPTS